MPRTFILRDVERKPMGVLALDSSGPNYSVACSIFNPNDWNAKEPEHRWDSKRGQRIATGRLWLRTSAMFNTAVAKVFFAPGNARLLIRKVLREANASEDVSWAIDTAAPALWLARETRRLHQEYEQRCNTKPTVPPSTLSVVKSK